MVNTTFKKVLISFLWEIEKSIKTLIFFFLIKTFLNFPWLKLVFLNEFKKKKKKKFSFNLHFQYYQTQENVFNPNNHNLILYDKR